MKVFLVYLDNSLHATYLIIADDYTKAVELLKEYGLEKEKVRMIEMSTERNSLQYI